MKQALFLSILLIKTNNFFSSEKLTIINTTKRTMCIAYDYQAFAILPDQTRELIFQTKKSKEIEFTVLNCMAAQTKIRILNGKSLIIVEVNRNVSILQHGKIIGCVSI